MVAIRKRGLTALTSRNLKDLLPSFLRGVSKKKQARPDLILAAWPELIGPRLAPMTRAVSFVDGLLSVKVRNSSLLSLLVCHERKRLLKELRQKFPHATIRNIQFSIG